MKGEWKMKLEEKKVAIEEAIKQADSFLETLPNSEMEDEEIDSSFEHLHQLLGRPYDDPNEEVPEIIWEHTSLMQNELRLLNWAANELKEAAKIFYSPSLPCDWADENKVHELSKENVQFYVLSGYDRIAIITAALDLISIYGLDATDDKFVEKYLCDFLGVDYGTYGVHHMYQAGKLRNFDRLQDQIIADYLVYDFLLKTTFKRVELTDYYALVIEQ